MQTKLDELLQGVPIVINIGVQDFAVSLQAEGVTVVHVAWSPPAGGDQVVIEVLDKLL